MCLHFNIMAHGNPNPFSCLYLFKSHLGKNSTVNHMLQGLGRQHNESKFGTAEVEQLKVRCSVTLIRVEIV